MSMYKTTLIKRTDGKDRIEKEEDPHGLLDMMVDILRRVEDVDDTDDEDIDITVRDGVIYVRMGDKEWTSEDIEEVGDEATDEDGASEDSCDGDVFMDACFYCDKQAEASIYRMLAANAAITARNLALSLPGCSSVVNKEYSEDFKRSEDGNDIIYHVTHRFTPLFEDGARMEDVVDLPAHYLGVEGEDACCCCAGGCDVPDCPEYDAEHAPCCSADGEIIRCCDISEPCGSLCAGDYPISDGSSDADDCEDDCDESTVEGQEPDSGYFLRVCDATVIVCDLGNGQYRVEFPFGASITLNETDLRSWFHAPKNVFGVEEAESSEEPAPEESKPVRRVTIRRKIVRRIPSRH